MQVPRSISVLESGDCGLVPFSGLGEKAGVATPKMDAVITFASQIAGRDFRASGRTLKDPGVSDMSVAKISSI